MWMEMAMSEAEEIEEAAGRVIDKLETEIGQLQARVAELKASVAEASVIMARQDEANDQLRARVADLEGDLEFPARANMSHTIERLTKQLEAKTELCEAWKKAAEAPFRHAFSCTNPSDADRCSCDTLRFLAIKKARALAALSDLMDAMKKDSDGVPWP